MTPFNKTAKGRLEVVCGSMFSGKTEELMRRLRRAEYAKQRVLAIKHQLDELRGHISITSHDGTQHPAFPIDGKKLSYQELQKLAGQKIDVLGIDEIQFFPPEIIYTIFAAIDDGVRVIVAGLDLDFRGEPFGIVPNLLAIADDAEKLTAICMRCGAEAHFTQRLVNGKPARYDDPIILVGAENFYEARCRDCYQIDKMPIAYPAQ